MCYCTFKFRSKPFPCLAFEYLSTLPSPHIFLACAYRVRPVDSTECMGLSAASSEVDVLLLVVDFLVELVEVSDQVRLLEWD